MWGWIRLSKSLKVLRQRVARDKYLGTQELDKILKEEIAGFLRRKHQKN
jgi:hypothetical protein